MIPESVEQIAPEAFSQTKAPGVYEEESFRLPRRIYFSTGVPIFLGTMARPAPKMAEEAKRSSHKPIARMLSLWSQFAQQIGQHDKGCHLAYAVRGFFDNGGHWCYVVVLKDRSDASLAAGLHAIEDLDGADLICAPDLSPVRDDALRQQQTIVEHCNDLGNRFALLDSRPGDQPGEVWKPWRSVDGRNCALYYPWVHVQNFDSGLQPELTSPCGHIAGIYSRLDRDRGVHKAPANEVLAGVVNLERKLTNHDQDSLNPNGVNCIRAFPGRGIRLWGARTLSSQTDWLYVNVRRLFLTAARWLDWNMLEMTFEPNTAKLWSRIERKLTEYFAAQYKMGALRGKTLKEAFYVKCDAENNPTELRNSGIVVAEIGLAPTIPYEFIVVRFIRGSRGENVTRTSIVHGTL